MKNHFRRAVNVIVLIALLIVLIPAPQDATANLNGYVSCEADQVHFSQDLIVVASTEAPGLFRLTDAGWKGFTAPAPWSQLRATPNKTLYLYDSTARTIYRSNDLGATWPITASFPPFADVYGTWLYPSPNPDELFMALIDNFEIGSGSDGIYKSANTGQDWQKTAGVGAQRMAFSPDFYNDGIAFATYYIYHGGGIVRSNNWGQSWSFANTDLPPILGADRSQIIFSPDFAHDHTLYLAFGDGLYKSLDAGQTWLTLRPSQLIWYSAHYIAISPNYAVDRTLSVINPNGGLEFSSDGATTWQPRPSPGGITPLIVAIRVVRPFESQIFPTPPAAPYHFYFPVVSAAYKQPLELWLIGYDGVGCRLYRSLNNGNKWEEVPVFEAAHWEFLPVLTKN